MKARFVFQVTADSIRRFADLTGDQSPLHTDPEFARQSRFRAVVAHGMLPFSYLSLLSSPPLSLRSVSVHFLRPVFVDEEVALTVEASEGRFHAEWKSIRSGTPLLNAHGTLAPGHTITARPAGSAGGKILAVSPALDALPITGALGKEAILSLKLGVDAARALAEIQRADLRDSNMPSGEEGHVAPEMLALIALSPLVGMKLPGKQGIFIDAEASFPDGIDISDPELRLAGRIEEVSAGSHRLRLVCRWENSRGVLGTGRVGAILTPSAPEAISCRTIRQRPAALDFRDQVALVIGASRGIGAATAKLLAMLGARVAVHYFQGAESGRAVVADIVENEGVAAVYGADIRRPDEVARLYDQVLREWGRVDVLVNCAVHDFSANPLVQTTWDDYAAEIDVTLRGLHECCRAAIPIMQRQRRGKIVNVSSIVTERPVSGQSKYATLKSALLGYTRSLAVELAPHGIQANLVVPGMTRTTLLAGIPEALLQRLGEESPSGRLLEPIEVAHSIAFLASRYADAISGQRLILNQGEAPFI